MAKDSKDSKDSGCVCLPEFLKGWKVQHWAIAHCALGALLLTLSLFVPRWRVDEIGTTEIQKQWGDSMLASMTFHSRQYGIIYVKGTYAQSWQTLALAICDLQSVGYAASWISAAGENPGDSEKCDNEKCGGGYFKHTAERCEVYRSIRVASHSTMGMTFVAIMMVIVACIVAAMASQKRMGGAVIGLFLCGGLFSLVSGTWWIMATDAGFKRLGESAYYPYPSIGIGYFMHLYGSLTLLIAGGVYGWIVWPVVSTWDEVQNKLDKKINRYEQRQEKKAQAQLKAQEAQMQQAQMMEQAQMQQAQMMEQQMHMQQQAYMSQAFPQPQQYGQAGQFGQAGQSQQLKANF